MDTYGQGNNTAGQHEQKVGFQARAGRAWETAAERKRENFALKILFRSAR